MIGITISAIRQTRTAPAGHADRIEAVLLEVGVSGSGEVDAAAVEQTISGSSRVSKR
jgi:hypothetical protein